MRCCKKEMGVAVGVGLAVAVGVGCLGVVGVEEGESVTGVSDAPAAGVALAVAVATGTVGDSVRVGVDVLTASAITCARGVVTSGGVTTRTTVAVGIGMGAQAASAKTAGSEK